MRLKINILKNIKTIKKGIVLAMIMLTINSFSQERVKVDGVIVVIGKNIVTQYDVDKFSEQIEMQSEGKVKLTNCEMLEEIMIQKLMAHHAVIDSVVVSEARVKDRVDRSIGGWSQQLGGIDKVVEFYGFDDEKDLRNELTKINREQFLVEGEKMKITEGIDITPDEIRTYFKSLEEGDNLPEFESEIEIAQIVIYAKPSEEEIQRVIDKLNSIKTDIENGSNMHMKAILNSDDPSVTSKGDGAGGFFTLTRDGGFDKRFKEVAFSLEVGEVSEPFKSEYGYHIIKVEKIRGQQIGLRHILIQPVIEESELLKARDTLVKVKKDVLEGKLTFEEAVVRYSQENKTKADLGLLINPQTQDSHFELSRMDPSIYGRVANLNAGEITDPFYDETREGEKMFKLFLLKSKTEPHIANFVDDYVKIQDLAIQKKKQESIEEWADTKIKETYIKINESFKSCSFEKNWIKK